MIFVFVVFLLEFSQSIVSVPEKLLRINEWHNLDVSDGAANGASLDLHLFATCERLSLLFSTEDREYTRFRFKFDDMMLKKIDVDSVTKFRMQNAPKVIGGCRETARKLLKIKIKTTSESVTFQIADQTIRRPFEKSSSGVLRVLLPQNVSCCLIRALYLSNSDRMGFGKNVVEREFTKLQRVSPRLRIFVQNNTMVNVAPIKVPEYPETATRISFGESETITQNTRNTSNTKNPWSKYTIGELPISSSTHKPNGEESWTHAVNKQWSVTFILCSFIICSLMLFLIVFGTFMVFYLMTKPKDGKSPYAIDA